MMEAKVVWFARRIPPPGYTLIDLGEQGCYWLSSWPDGDTGEVVVTVYPERARRYNQATRAGYCRVLIDHPRPSIWFLSEIHVQPAYRRRGVGSAMLRHIIENARSRGVTYLIGWTRTMAGVPLSSNLLAWCVRRGFRVERLQSVQERHNIVLRPQPHEAGYSSNPTPTQ